MNSHRLFLAAALTWTLPLIALRADQPPASPDGVEVQARGPVHEAFAQPVNRQPEPGPVVPKQPPDPIEEVPPDEKPEGDNVQWIPGYWAWDDEQTNFLWVSGFWRVPPPARTWVSGHWQEVDTGWQWTNGFWASADTTELHYLPPPPPPADQGPSTEAPDANSIYVPGCWVYSETRYLWRPGYWIAYRPHWVWCPAYYIWTPSGCLFVEGFWDHPFDERGLLFAPVRFTADWGRRQFVPSLVVNTDFLLGALFVRNSYHQYFFGDYFEANYSQRGFVSWTDYRWAKVGVDPNFAYYRQLHRGDERWEASLKDLYRARQAGEVPRPPRTFRQQVEVVNQINSKQTANAAVNANIQLTHAQNVTALTPLNQVHNKNVTNLGGLGGKPPPADTGRQLKLQKIQGEEHARELKAAEQIRNTANQRRELEGKMLHEGQGPVKHTDAPRPQKFETPKPLPHATPPAPPVKQVPAMPMVPKHEEKTIPQFEPPKSPGPPKKKPAKEGAK